MEFGNVLKLKRCPHCSIASPSIKKIQSFQTTDANGRRTRNWNVYFCNTCGGIITCSQSENLRIVDEIFPGTKTVDSSIPEKAREFLSQSIESIHAPSGSIMLAASSIDAMLKEKGYKEGSLFKRIDEAVNNHLITKGMSDWAHQIRLEANDQRHADEDALLPTEKDAKRILEFALALAEFLYVLPSRIIKGIEDTKNEFDEKMEDGPDI